MIVYWLWTGTAIIPEKEVKNVGLGLTLPLYLSGSSSVGWWAIFITMMAMLSAFMSLVFGYFFFWTVRDDFPPSPDAGPGIFWPSVSGALLLGAWAFTIVARYCNGRDSAFGFYGALIIGISMAVFGAVALLAGPWQTGLDPMSHVYPATVWIVAIWTVLQTLIGVIMQIYCIARRIAGRMTARYDIDIGNVTLYWHFTALTAAVTVAVIAGFPLVA